MQSEPTFMSTCNKCGTQYPSAPVGNIHKCGNCSGGMMVRNDAFVFERKTAFIEKNYVQPALQRGERVVFYRTDNRVEVLRMDDPCDEVPFWHLKRMGWL